MGCLSDHGYAKRGINVVGHPVKRSGTHGLGNGSVARHQGWLVVVLLKVPAPFDVSNTRGPFFPFTSSILFPTWHTGTYRFSSLSSFSVRRYIPLNDVGNS